MIRVLLPRPIFLGKVKLDMPVFLAPMAGITDLPFRRAVTHFGAGLVVSEMVASSEVVTTRPSSRALVRARAPAGGTVPVSVQIAGREPVPMAETARIVAGMGAGLIDINMGCPAKKVTGGLSGAALMRDLDHALRLIDAVVKAVDLPVTLKMRLGWDSDSVNAPELASRAYESGICMLTVHGRTRAQFYRGSADWTAIRDVANLPDRPPLVANGDIVNAASAYKALMSSGADAVMIGRGAQGAPWKLAEIAHELYGLARPQIPVGPALADFVAGHYEDMIEFYGTDPGLRIARKHLGWYADANGASGAKQQLFKTESPAETLHIIRHVFSDAGVS